MKKSTRIVKKLIALFLVVLMSIESFAAVVSDNDGSAFITKAEFDSMKNDFQSQIDQYNTSIDSKIDGAIAAYLAGINLNKTNQKQLIFNSWKSVNVLNGVLDQSYQYPDFSADVFLGYLINHLLETTGYDKSIWCFWKLRYSGSIDKNNKRNVVTGTRVNQTVNDIVWAGQYLSVREAWTLSASYFKHNNRISGGDIPGVSTGSTFHLRTPLNLAASGNVAVWAGQAASLFWYPTFGYLHSNGTTWRDLSGLTTHNPIERQSSIGASISFGADVGNEHICTFTDDTDWELCLKDDNLFWNTSSNNGNRTAGWLTKMSDYKKWWGFESNTIGGRSPASECNAVISDNTSSSKAGSENNATIPTIGLIGSLKKPTEIAQFSKGDAILEDGTSVDKLYLNQGLILMPVKAGEVIEWKPNFTDVTIEGVDSANEVKIALSYKPFTTKYTTCNSGDSQNIDDYVNINDLGKGVFPVTTDNTIKLKFTADRDGFVYAKWWPDDLSDTDLVDKKWSINLNLSTCNSYSSTKE